MGRYWLTIPAVMALTLSGCGLFGQNGVDPVEAGGLTPSGGASTLTQQGFPEECPTPAETFNQMNHDTYQVFGQIDYLDQDTGNPVSQHLFIGTAWAVGDHLLATNAHVTEAFKDTAEQGVQFSRAIAVQSGTGTVVRLLRGLTHPDYDGNPLGSPDVGLFTVQDKLPSALPLAPVDSVVDLGGEFQLVGFPGDVDEFITVTPGETVPQATSLSGTVTARRSHDDTQQVTLDSLDVYQHQAPTTPGTSGSAIAHCGLVIAINNAGTVKLVVTPDESGEMSIDRTAAASNNFAVHVRYIHSIVELFRANAIQGFELPVPAVIPQQAAAGGELIIPGRQPAGEPPSDGQTQQNAIEFQGVVETEPQHTFWIVVDLDTNEVTGESDWDGNPYLLNGWVDLDTGEFMFIDNGPEVDPEFLAGYYFGYIYEDGSMEGYYAEDETTTFALEGLIVQ